MAPSRDLWKSSWFIYLSFQKLPISSFPILLLRWVLPDLQAQVLHEIYVAAPVCSSEIHTTTSPVELPSKTRITPAFTWHETSGYSEQMDTNGRQRLYVQPMKRACGALTVVYFHTSMRLDWWACISRQLVNTKEDLTPRHSIQYLLSMRAEWMPNWPSIVQSNPRVTLHTSLSTNRTL